MVVYCVNYSTIVHNGYLSVIYLQYCTSEDSTLILTPVCTAAMSDRDNLLTSTNGSCGVDHDPKLLCNDKLLESSIVDWLKIPENKLECWWSAMPSTLDKQHLRELTVCGGGTDLAKIHAR